MDGCVADVATEAVGPMAWSGHQQVFLGEDLMTQGRVYSDDTAKIIDTEISGLLHRQEQRLAAP